MNPLQILFITTVLSTVEFSTIGHFPSDPTPSTPPIPGRFSAKLSCGSELTDEPGIIGPSGSGDTPEAACLDAASMFVTNGNGISCKKCEDTFDPGCQLGVVEENVECITTLNPNDLTYTAFYALDDSGGTPSIGVSCSTCLF